ncbi:MAG: PIN domain-containing protein [Leptospirales bacterium]
MKKIYIDSDILLDIFLLRDKFYNPASELLTLADLKKVHAVTTPLVFSNLFYILSKYKSKNLAIKTLRTLEAILEIIPVTRKSTTLGLNSKFSDFEDALQYFSSVEAGVKYIITRNSKDYKHSKIPVMSAEQFMLLYNKVNTKS